MTYWGPIRAATLKNLNDAELHRSGEDCARGARHGLAKAGAACVLLTLGVFLAPTVAIFPPLCILAAPYLLYTSYKQACQNLDGMQAHRYEEARRVLLTMSPPQPAPKPAVEPTPAPSPVFNGQAAVVLDTDITPMKRIQITARSAPAAR